ncbi:MAG TPA: glycosyltransferase family 87 protein [Vicinamibacterales bacterium]|nr:glycosyltransferase family 87 protein [Vicinamibacterales bacterium]
MRRAIGLALLAAAFVSIYVGKASRRMPDFFVYWQVGARAAHAEPIYRVSDGEYQFKYFPEFAPLAIPIGALPLRVAKVVWYAGLVAAFLAVLRLALRVLPERRKPAALLVTILIVGLGKSYAEELVLGQINLLLTLIVLCTILALARGRDILAGLLIALAVVVKPYALILTPWLLVRGRFRAIAAAIGGGVAAFLLLAAVYGPRAAVALHVAWWRTVRDTTVGTLMHPENVSLAGMYGKWFGATPTAAWLTAATALALLLAAAIVMFARRGVAQPDGLELGLLIALTPLLSPQGWDYVLVVFTPAVAYVVNYADALPRPVRWLTALGIAAVGLTLYDLLGRRLFYLLIMNSVTTLGALVIVGSLVLLRLRKAA